MGKSIGIDLGTTNSVASYFDGYRSLVLLNSLNEELTPSVVMCQPPEFQEEEDQMLVGRTAVNQAKLSPENAIFSIKRLMGRPYNHPEVQRLRNRVAYRVLESTDGTQGLAAVMMGDTRYLPEDISTFILKEIKRYSETALGAAVTHAVITVPAYFKDPQIVATQKAGLQAGFIVKTVLPEPTAAAIAFGTEISLTGNRVLVFDLGGGTFDISVIAGSGENYKVITEYGDEFLGGDDFDDELVGLVLKHVQTTYGVDLSGDLRFRIIAKAEAEAAKKSLSNLGNSFVNIVIPEAARVGEKVINVKLKVSKEEFEQAISPYVARCEQLVNEALTEQNLRPEDISDVLLVGGATAVPMVYRSMEALFGKEKIRRNIDPMKCVAIGAGILAYKMQGIQCPKCKEISDESLSSCPQCGTSLAAAPAVLKGMSIAEKTVQNYLVEVLSSEEDSRKLKILVEKGTPVPMDAPVVYTFRTTEDGQTAIRIPVYQGMASTVQQNQLIGTVEYDLSRKLSLNHPVQVEFRISRNRNIEITIDDGGARQEKELKLGLRQEMTNQPQPESTTEADEEEARAERERILSVLDSYIAYAGDFVNEYGHLLTAQEKQSISAALEAAAKINDQRDAENAVLHSRKLSTMLGRCGTASLIAQAYAAASNTPDATIQSELREKADQLKRAAENRDRGAINALTDPVASLVRQVHESHEEVARIYAVKKHGRLLREG